MSAQVSTSFKARDKMLLLGYVKINKNSA